MKNQIKSNISARYYWRHVKAYPKLLAGVIISVPLTVLVNRYLPALLLPMYLSRLSQARLYADKVWASFGPELVAYLAFFYWYFDVADCRLLYVATRNAVRQDIAEDVFKH